MQQMLRQMGAGRGGYGGYGAGDRELMALIQQNEQLRQAAAAKPKQAQTFEYDLNNLNKEEQQEIFQQQKKFAKNALKSQILDQDLQMLIKSEAYKDEKNAYSNNAVARTLTIKPTRTRAAAERLNDGDTTFFRDTKSVPYQNLKQKGVDLRDHKDRLYAQRLERILFESQDINTYDLFSRAVKEAKNRAQRISALKKYVDFQLRRNGYRNPVVPIPPLFKIGRADMASIFEHRRKVFVAGAQNSVAGLVSTVGILFQSVFAILTVLYLEGAEGNLIEAEGFETTKVSRISRVIAISCIAIFMQVFFYRRGFSTLSPPGSISHTTGMFASVILSLYCSFLFKNTVQVKDAANYKKARYSLFAVIMFQLLISSISFRALVLTNLRDYASNDSVKTYTFLSFGAAASLALIIIAPTISEQPDKCDRISDTDCLRQLKPSNLRDLIQEKAYEAPGGLRDCVSNMGIYDGLLIGAFNNLQVPDEI